MKRRALIGALAAAVAFAAAPTRRRRALRPPGALAPHQFERACIGCFRCAEVCPTQVIRFEAMTPVLDFTERACVLCMKCAPVCPTGALRVLAPTAVRIGVPTLHRERCLSWTGRGVCRLCFLVCPFPEQAVFLVGPQKAPLFEPGACAGCGLCQDACPDSAQAIVIEPEAA